MVAGSTRFADVGNRPVVLPAHWLQRPVREPKTLPCQCNF
jgi:hypothetical protein